MKRKALGKGLGALIPERPAGPENRIETIPLGQIKPGNHQPRRTFKPDHLEELAVSIRENGVIQPIVLRPIPTGYEIVAGERRWRAARMAGLDRIPAVIRPLDDKQALAVSLIENLQRDDLNPMEAARGYRRLMDQFDLTQEDIARTIGKNRATIANTLRLLRLPPEIQAFIEDASLSTGHAKALLSLTNEPDMVLLALETMKNDWSVRQLEFMVRKITERPTARPTAPSIDPNLTAAIDTLRKRFATRIQCKPKRSGGGSIVFEYYNSDDLIRLLDLLGI